MEQRLNPFYLKSGSADPYDILIVNASNQMEFTPANTLIAAIVAATPSDAGPHPFLLSGM